MKTKTYSFYADTGHGWLKVSRMELIKLGIIDKISSYSYQRKDSVYLEEDCDLSVFYDAMRDKGIQVKFREFTTETKRSKIRSYDYFVP